ncbi:MAG: T9SS type A sorting domain-containing protein [Bacteroidota bacterium]|nr:T9SS type A sorting domain-containing protein [Bacteroidota bacterium]
MVYSSSNKIWFTTSSDNGSTWSSEQQISGSGTASSPSIATDVWGDDVYIVWQEVVGNTKYLYIKSLYGYVPTPQVLDSDVSSFDLQQSLAVSDDVTVLVVYRKSNGLGGPWKLYYTYSNDGSNFSAGQQVFVSTPVDFDYPSIAWNPQIDSFMVSASSRSYSYTVPLFTFSGTTWEWPCNVYPSTSSFPPTTPYSQIAVDGYGRTHVTWIAYDDYYTGGEFPSSAAMERNYYNGSLSAISIFRVQDVPIIYTSVSGHNDANGGASLFFCGNPTDYLRDIYSTDGSSWNGTINISPSGNRINYPISLEKAPPSSVTYTVVKGSSSPYNVISQTKDNSQPGYGYGTLKTASDASAQTATLYRRIELIDTTTGGLLAVQFGNISGNSSPFQNINPGGSHGKGISDFMKTSPFTLQQNASMEAEFGVRSKDWKRNANISLELVDTVSGKTVQQIGSYNFAASDTGSFFQEKTNQVVNKLQNINGILRVKIDSVNYENLVVNYMNVFFFGGSGSIKKQEKNIVQIGEIPAEFQVSQNYPNPFNPTTQINYQLPANCRVTLKVYDVLGREIATLVDEEKPSGFYSVQWDAHNVSSGIYFYRIIVSNSNGQSSFTEAKRMVVMK